MAGGLPLYRLATRELAAWDECNMGTAIAVRLTLTYVTPTDI